MNNIINIVVGLQKYPKIIKRDFFVPLDIVRCSREGSDGLTSYTRDEVLVVSMVLGEGLLEDGTPEGLILRDCGEEGSIATSLLFKR